MCEFLYRCLVGSTLGLLLGCAVMATLSDNRLLQMVGIVSGAVMVVSLISVAVQPCEEID